MSNEKFGLSQNVLMSLKTILKKQPKIQKVILYGSRATGNFKPGSDIDLSLVAPDMSLPELLALENEIDDLLLPYKVDLSLYHTLDNLDLREQIDCTGVDFFIL